jgi:hypothetical protein
VKKPGQETDVGCRSVEKCFSCTGIFAHEHRHDGAIIHFPIQAGRWKLQPMTDPMPLGSRWVRRSRVQRNKDRCGRDSFLRSLWENSQYFLNTPMTFPCSSTAAAGTIIGFIVAFEGCNRMLFPSL